MNDSLRLFGVTAAAIMLLVGYTVYLAVDNDRISTDNNNLWEYILRDPRRDPDAQKRLLEFASIPALAALFRTRKNSSNQGASDVPNGWVPISVSGLDSNSPMVTLCAIPFHEYSKNPTKTPMFRDLVTTYCKRSTMVVPLSTLANLPKFKEPTGFVFHESRCGSTLVADMLAVDTDSMVYSESSPPQQILTDCESCSVERKISLLRIVMNAMGNSAKHSRLFFKFQSMMTMQMNIIIQAFPNVPWIFLFRDPIEVLASYTASGSAFSMYHCEKFGPERPPPNEIVEFLDHKFSSVSGQHRCVAYFHHICDIAYNAAKNSENHMGVLVNYADLPSHFIDFIIPNHFSFQPQFEIIQEMQRVSTLYSKSRGTTEEFHSDSQKKYYSVKPEMRAWIEKKSFNLYREMSKFSIISQHKRNSQRSTSEFMLQNSHVGMDRLNIESKAFLEEANITRYAAYPKLEKLTSFLKQWPPDQPEVPNIEGINEGSLLRFDFSNETQREMALFYRKNEIPFMLYNVPEITKVVNKWTQDYLIQQFGEGMQSVTRSNSNHFMYYLPYSVPEGYKQPTYMQSMSYSQFLEKAKEAQNATKVDIEHYYLQLGSYAHSYPWIRDDISVFREDNEFFIADPDEYKGIHCRFGNRGVIAETHYDGGRNFVAMLKGAKRYILLPPSECKLLYLYQRPHPEARHSAVDWSQLNEEKYPLMKEAMATQVVVREGEVLYIPSYWFHYIISTNISAQCNVRSGEAIRGRNLIADCGFY